MRDGGVVDTDADQHRLHRQLRDPRGGHRVPLVARRVFDERFQSRIVPVRTSDFASSGSEVKRCQLAASQMFGEIRRG